MAETDNSLRDMESEPLMNTESINRSTENAHFRKLLTIVFRFEVVLAVLIALIVGLLVWNIVLTNDLKKKADTPSGPQLPPAYNWLKDDISSKMDFSANPCNDFYQYSCGTFESTTVLPPGTDAYIPVFDIITVQNFEIINSIANDQWPLIHDMYTSCMLDGQAVEADTEATIASWAAQISQLPSTQDKDLLPLLAQIHQMNADAFFYPGVQNNILAQGNNLLFFQQAGLSMDAGDYSDPGYRASLLKQISAVLSFVNSSSVQYAQAVLDLETSLANIFADIQDITDYFHTMTYGDFLTLSGLDFDIYIQSLSAPAQISTNLILVDAPTFFASQNLTTLIHNANLVTVQNYLIYRMVINLIIQFPSAFPAFQPQVEATHKNALKNKYSDLLNIPKLKTLLTDTDFTTQQLYCLSDLTNILGDFIGLLFDMMVVNQDVVDAIHTVTGGVQNAFKNSLTDLTWIDDTSKSAVRYKLANIIQIIGHPNKLDRYRGVVLDPAHYLSNVLTTIKQQSQESFLDVGTPFNRSNYEFPATIVNAFYSPMTNTINFPAGILESPMFSVSFPKILQYARMGMVIGHETTHGFDNNGRLWNAEGLYQSILDDQSSANFDTQSQCIVNQYNAFEALPGYYVNGQQTLGENIADLGGVKNSFRAYKAWVAANGAEFADHAVISQLTQDQLFFVMYGQTWCSKFTDAAIINQLQNDEHSPSKFRVNGPLASFDEFSKAFSCPAGSPMNPKQKCGLW